ncbi:MAG: hypothetical protein Q8R46_04630, partial [Nitrosomonas sp.]|nr:hypothetical protein [Nitrosomonas sp.]
MSLFEEDWQTDVSAVEAEIEQLLSIAPQKPKRERAGRQSLPDHLPRIEHRDEPQSCQCKQCGSKLVKIGEDCDRTTRRQTCRILRASSHSATPTADTCRLTTTPSKTLFAPSRSVRETGCSPAPSAPGNVLPPSKLYSAPQNSTAS